LTRSLEIAYNFVHIIQWEPSSPEHPRLPLYRCVWSRSDEGQLRAYADCWHIDIYLL